MPGVERVTYLQNGEVDELDLNGVDVSLESMGEINGHEIYQLHIWAPSQGRALASFTLTAAQFADGPYRDRLTRHLSGKF